MLTQSVSSTVICEIDAPKLGGKVPGREVGDPNAEFVWRPPAFQHGARRRFNRRPVNLSPRTTTTAVWGRLSASGAGSRRSRGSHPPLPGPARAAICLRGPRARPATRCTAARSPDTPAGTRRARASSPRGSPRPQESSRHRASAGARAAPEPRTRQGRDWPRSSAGPGRPTNRTCARGGSSPVARGCRRGSAESGEDQRGSRCRRRLCVYIDRARDRG